MNCPVLRASASFHRLHHRLGHRQVHLGHCRHDLLGLRHGDPGRHLRVGGERELLLDFRVEDQGRQQPPCEYSAGDHYDDRKSYPQPHVSCHGTPPAYSVTLRRFGAGQLPFGMSSRSIFGSGPPISGSAYTVKSPVGIEDSLSYMAGAAALTPPATIRKRGGAGPAGVQVAGVPLQGHHHVRGSLLRVDHGCPPGPSRPPGRRCGRPSSASERCIEPGFS